LLPKTKKKPSIVAKMTEFPVRTSAQAPHLIYGNKIKTVSRHENQKGNGKQMAILAVHAHRDLKQMWLMRMVLNSYWASYTAVLLTFGCFKKTEHYGRCSYSKTNLTSGLL
jgi:hypothetical protein